MYMARIVLVVDAEEKELWVKQAHLELTTLSEWLRRAARERSGERWPSEPGAPRPVPLSEWTPQIIGATEVSKEQLEQITFVDLDPANCRRVKIHHVYHAGSPCPLCGFPQSAVAPNKEV